MRILVIGASGFIGRNFILRAAPDWEIIAVYNQSRDFVDFLATEKKTKVKAFKCDLKEFSAVAALFGKRNASFDVCLYSAGNSDIGLSAKEPLFDLNSNLISLINLLSNLKAKKFIYMSSGSVYLGSQGEVSEETPVNPVMPYGINKLASELYIKYFAEQRKNIAEYVILRFFGAYGPWELSRKIYTNLIKDFYLNNQDEFTIRGDGENLIDAMYVDDAIEGILKIIEQSRGNLTLDFSSGEPLTINQLVKKSAAVFGKEKIKINHTGSSSEYIRFYSRSDKLKELFGFRSRTSLEQGMLKFAEFCKRRESKG